MNAEGRGPAWANSLFEDNAEFGLGMRLARDAHGGDAKLLVAGSPPPSSAPLAVELLDADQANEAGIAAQRERVGPLTDVLAGMR